ncbi:MAG: 16S rRNA (cytidine(1402)-2'-O)-methyltransferase [Clostridia bacterium]|nr:16S rRNA (cytidine(1402)-2'-O)-methyltransferase [Clostridia bacterium]
MPKLYVVATPIGNLNDLTERMREALTEADLIAAEDTRVTMKLLSHYDLKKPMVSCHRHNEEGRSSQIVERMLAEDLTVALTCDAGTPGISDPGHLLVDACHAASIKVEPISGPSAVVTALSASGFDAREFAFYGFLPREKKPLREKLNAIRKSGVPVAVLYESPHRVTDLVGEIAGLYPEARLCVCSDLTKRFERIDRGTAAEVHAMLAANANVDKGEYCIVVDFSTLAPAETTDAPVIDCTLFLLSRILEDRDLSEAAVDAKDAGSPRTEIYKAKLRIAEQFDC